MAPPLLQLAMSSEPWFGYVTPSEPHTGKYSNVLIIGQTQVAVSLMTSHLAMGWLQVTLEHSSTEAPTETEQDQMHQVRNCHSLLWIPINSGNFMSQLPVKITERKDLYEKTDSYMAD